MIGRPSILKTRNVPNKDNKHTGTRDVIPFKNPDPRHNPNNLLFLPHSKPQTTPSPTSKLANNRIEKQETTPNPEN